MIKRSAIEGFVMAVISAALMVGSWVAMNSAPASMPEVAAMLFVVGTAGLILAGFHGFSAAA